MCVRGLFRSILRIPSGYYVSVFGLILLLRQDRDQIVVAPLAVGSSPFPYSTASFGIEAEGVSESGCSPILLIRHRAPEKTLSPDRCIVSRQKIVHYKYLRIRFVPPS